MNLTLSQITNAAQGCVRIEQTEQGAFRFYRFSAAAERFYEKYHLDFYKKTFATPGVRLLFQTDSSALSLTVEGVSKSSRNWYNFDILVNDTRVGSVGNIADDRSAVTPDGTNGGFPDFPCGAYPMGKYETRIGLGSGEKTVEIIFSMLCRGELFSLSLDDGASFIPVRREKTMLIYGDSITHGYDAIHPADHYTEIMARTLGYSVYNLGIGGEMFNPGLAACGYPVTPDVILTAYGTNDWSNLPAETLEPNTWGFFRTLREKFPDSRIVALTPVERGDSGTPRKYGSFDRIAALLKTVAAEIPGMDAVDCTAFIPKDPAYFSPDFLHPVDRGFAPYADGVIAALKKLGL